MANKTIDLNDVLIPDDRSAGVELFDPIATSGPVSCHFRGIRRALLDFIDRYSVIVGCVAWLTDEEVLRSLARKEAAVIIVQKEDFLRPDVNRAGDRSRVNKHRLRELYGALKSASRFDFPAPLRGCSIASDYDIEGVRCVGMSRVGDGPRPSCHHKFIVGGNIMDIVEPNGWGQIFVPSAVWTGSFNFTENSRRSLENAVVVEDAKIAAAYTREFAQVAALSEPLDWFSEYVAPEWRIGT